MPSATDHSASPAAHLLQGLNAAQAEAVTSPAMPLRILAGAGSGKTRVLTRRIAHRVLEESIDPSHVLAVTFTRKAARELRQRLGALRLPGPVTTGTFHALAAAQLRQRWEERRIEPPQLLDRRVGFVARLMPRTSAARSTTATLDVVGEIEWAKARMIPASEYPAAAAAAIRRPSVDPGTVAGVYERYEKEKLARRMVDFDDLLRLATRDLRADEEFAAARRWRFRHLFVDEFQDVNPLQHALLREWMGDRLDLCVVGDPNQAIYAWNGADASYLLDFEEHFPTAATVVLDENYRSTPQILGIANAVLSTGRAHHFELRPTLDDGPVPDVRRLADEVAEARFIARNLRDAHAPGRTWASQAVLVRTNAQLPVIEEELRRAGIPFHSRSSGRFLDQPEIRDAMAQLRASRDRSLLVGIDDLELSLGTDDADDETDGGDNDTTMLDDERLANVAELVRLGREYLNLDPGGTYGGFSTWVTATLRSDDGLGHDAVELATFHAAKGLEFDVVHLAGMEEGLVPISHARTNDALDEERRLLYVALTRARRACHMSWVERRTFGSRAPARKPSPYLETVELAMSLLASGRPATDLGAAIAAERARLRDDTQGPAAGRRREGRRQGPSGGEPLDATQQALFDDLKGWRLTQSRAADVPAFVIFNDATLAEVARRRPKTRVQLLDVPGIGPVKAERFGDALLAVVAQHS